MLMVSLLSMRLWLHRQPLLRAILPRRRHAHMGMAPAGEDCAQQRLPVEP